MAVVVSAFRGVTHVRFPVFQHHQFPATRVSGKQRNLKWRSNRLTLFARYSQTQNLFTSRLQDSIENLPKLVEDILQTSINTGPRGAIRMAQGIQAVVGVGSEWLADVSKSTKSSAGFPTQLQLGLLSPVYLRRLFERMGATYIKLGQMKYVADDSTMFWAVGAESSVIAKHAEFCEKEVEMIVPFEGVQSGELPLKLVLKEWQFSGGEVPDTIANLSNLKILSLFSNILWQYSEGLGEKQSPFGECWLFQQQLLLRGVTTCTM